MSKVWSGLEELRSTEHGQLGRPIRVATGGLIARLVNRPLCCVTQVDPPLRDVVLATSTSHIGPEPASPPGAMAGRGGRLVRGAAHGVDTRDVSGTFHGFGGRIEGPRFLHSGRYAVTALARYSVRPTQLGRLGTAAHIPAVAALPDTREKSNERCSGVPGDSDYSRRSTGARGHRLASAVPSAPISTGIGTIGRARPEGGSSSGDENSDTEG